MFNLLLSVIGAFAEFERSLIKEYQLEGSSIAKRQGVYEERKKRYLLLLSKNHKLYYF